MRSACSSAPAARWAAISWARQPVQAVGASEGAVTRTAVSAYRSLIVEVSGIMVPW